MPGVYNVVISIDGVNFDPTSPTNRSLRGVAATAGPHTVAWDGRDNSGNFFPVGSYQVHASFHGGEYHFPMIDVENDTQGGPTITLLNPPGGTCPPLAAGCTSGFYDDRAYRTLNGTVVDSGNTAGSVLCGNNPPATAFSDPINGYDTRGNQRAFGTGGGGNTNVPCTGAFGDTKGLGTWTYFPSNTVLAPLNIVATAADIAIGKTVSNFHTRRRHQHHLYCHCAQQRAQRDDHAPGDRSPAGGPHIRLRESKPGHVQLWDWRVDCRRAGQRGHGDASNRSDRQRNHTSDQHSDANREHTGRSKPQQ